MEVILLEKIPNTGDIGDLVNVRNGHARNFLIPQKKAMRATPEAKALAEEKCLKIAADQASRLQKAQIRAEQAVREILLSRLCGEEGQLYGSVSPADIAEEMSNAGSDIDKSEIHQPDGPIKHIGEFEIDVILHPDVQFIVRVHVEAGESGHDLTN